MKIAIRDYANRHNITVERAQALQERGLKDDPGVASSLVSSFVAQTIELGSKSEEKSDDDSEVGSTKSVVTFRTR